MNAVELEFRIFESLQRLANIQPKVDLATWVEPTINGKNSYHIELHLLVAPNKFEKTFQIRVKVDKLTENHSNEHWFSKQWVQSPEATSQYLYNYYQVLAEEMAHFVVDEVKSIVNVDQQMVDYLDNIL